MSKRHSTIDRTVAEQIRRLHRKHPSLGHEGLFKLLKESGTTVDETDLRLFMKEKKIQPESGGTAVPASSFPVGLSWPEAHHTPWDATIESDGGAGVGCT